MEEASIAYTREKGTVITGYIAVSKQRKRVGKNNRLDARQRKIQFMSFVCDDSDGKHIAIRAQHGMPSKVGVLVSVTHARFTFAALEFAPNLFQMAADVQLPYVVLHGLAMMKRIGSMHSLYPPWDMRSLNMQRWGVGLDYNILLVFDASIMFYHMGWRYSDPGSWFSEAGACIPDTVFFVAIVN